MNYNVIRLENYNFAHTIPAEKDFNRNGFNILEIRKEKSP